MNELLARLTQAEDVGATARARELRSEIFAYTSRERARDDRESGRGPSSLEYLLFASMGRDLEDAMLHARAAVIYEAAIDHAASHREPYWQRFFRLRSAHLCLDGLSSVDAARWLAWDLFESSAGSQPLLLEDPSAWFEGALERIAREVARAPRVESIALSDLRAQRAATLGRWLVFTGRLRLGIRSYESALSFLRERDDPFLSSSDIRVALAEANLDRGDLRAFHAVRAEARVRNDPETDTTLLLDSTAALQQGRISDALALCRRARSRGDDTRSRAAEREVELLILLNRLTDAASLLERVPRARLNALLEARRAWYDDLPPTVPEMLRDAHDSWSHEAGDSPGPPANHPDTGPARLFERPANEWAIRSQHALLRLAANPSLADLERVALLVAWAETIDSPLIAAERMLLMAVAAFASDRPLAARLARSAEQQFLALDMPHRARDACHVVGRADARGRDSENHAREAHLLSVLQSRLTPSDWHHFRLNKWDNVDRQLADRLDASADLDDERGIQELWRDLSRLRSGAANDGHIDVIDRLHWLPRRVALIQYFCLPDRLVALLSVRGRTHVFHTPTTRVELWRAVEELVRVLQVADSPPGYKVNTLREASSAVGRALGLSALLQKVPASVDRLAIVPDDVLVHVPFAAVTAEGVAVLERFAVSIMPSPQWTRGPDSDGATRPRYAVGIGVTRSCLDVADLPSARQEIEALCEASPHAFAELSDDTATIANALDELVRADLAHFACHAEFDPEEPERRGLALRDRWLTFDDVRRQHLEGLRLATVASCWTGNSRVLPGSELIGLAGAFLHAGAQAVITSLWEAPQEVGIPTAKGLYLRLPHMGVADALASLQRSLRDERRDGGARRPPVDWAGLTCYQRALRPRWRGLLALWAARAWACVTRRSQKSSASARA